MLPAAFALALLYLTVLSFGLLATAYLNWRGMSEAELSIYRGLGAIAGISATFIFPPMHGKLGEPPPRHRGPLPTWLHRRFLELCHFMLFQEGCVCHPN